ncbi:PBSX family phage portal protein [Alcanivorax sp. S71-1-4]|uniref:phage portal protein n=1 Tax=Alcanivorax sp. S71-1-4 TaxID=1177159 RepID=UPI00135A5F11|nr:phage portal protein [Alcanivorax sp. S71-1-4]KAF0810449.1 PBSX family phage portal protein [Alcanivorax sp. S71-1-4]
MTAEDSAAVKPKQEQMQVFTFGEPESVVTGRELLDYVEAWHNGRWYEPPVSFEFLAKFFRASPHHSSSIYVKRNILQSCFIPHPKLSRAEFTKWALDYMTFGNGYLELQDSMLGQPLRFKHALARYTRRGMEEGDYWYIYSHLREHQFKQGKVFHLMEPDINQEIYGLPEYLSSIQSGLLNEAATIFRRRYYQNGSHAGFILYMSDAAQEEQDVDNLREALRNAKGPGNFRNLFMYSPNGKKDGIQVIPISEVMAKDDFLNIKDTSRDDVLAAHRIPAALIGIIPKNTSGFGDVEKTTRALYRNEVVPLQARFEELNDWIGEEVVRFKPYTFEADVDE